MVACINMLWIQDVQMKQWKSSLANGREAAPSSQVGCMLLSLSGNKCGAASFYSDSNHVLSYCRLTWWKILTQSSAHDKHPLQLLLKQLVTNPNVGTERGTWGQRRGEQMPCLWKEEKKQWRISASVETYLWQHLPQPWPETFHDTPEAAGKTSKIRRQWRERREL